MYAYAIKQYRKIPWLGKVLMSYYQIYLKAFEIVQINFYTFYYLQRMDRFPQYKEILLLVCILLQFPLQSLSLQTYKIFEMCNQRDMQKDSEHNSVKVANGLVSAIYWSSKRHNNINIKTYLYLKLLYFLWTNTQCDT